jgi:hypothetical protein
MLIQLDRSVPFVTAALEVANGAPADRAAEVLAAAEQRHGVQIRDTDSADSHMSQATWARECLHPFLTELHLVLSGGDLLLVHDLKDSNGLDLTPTWRMWGEWLAEWANTSWFSRPAGLGVTAWTQANRRWEYLDFYDHGNLAYLVADYATWRDAVIKIIGANCERARAAQRL